MKNRIFRHYAWEDGKTLTLGEKSVVMGVLNVTPDSFSDGGKWNTAENSRIHAEDMISDGADILDVGAESTGPGSTALTAAEEIRRLDDCLSGILEVSTVPVSVDSYHYETIEYALHRGAHIVNDIWGFQQDDGSMARVSAEAGVPVVLMHNSRDGKYGSDIIDSMKNFFDRSLHIAFGAGVKEENIILDPGIGFSKDSSQNMEILQRLDELTGAYPFPWLLGVSRKRFIGTVLGGAAAERDPGTAAVNLWGAQKGCQIFRVHNVGMTAMELKMWDALCSIE